MQAELYAIKKLDRESLTNDTNDALLKVKIIAKPTDGGTSLPVEKLFNITLTDENEVGTVSPMTGTLVTTSNPLTVTPSFKVT